MLACLLLAACGTTPPSSPDWWMGQKPNSCLPTAIAFRESLRGKAVWSEVVVYEYFSEDEKKMMGHAIVAYLYPIGKNQLWTYDAVGSTRVRAYITSPVSIAQQSEAVRGRPRNKITKAEFLK